MVTDDKIARTIDLDDNCNNRDQRNVGIWVLILVLLFMGFLVILGLSHAPSDGKAQEASVPSGTLPASGTSSTSGNVESRAADDPHFSVNAPVAEVEQPGTIGEEQHFLTGHGNTPAPAPTNNTVQQAPGSGSAGTGPATTPVATPAPSHPSSSVPAVPAAAVGE